MANYDSFEVFSSSYGEKSDIFLPYAVKASIAEEIVIENLNSTAKDTKTSEAKCV